MVRSLVVLLAIVAGTIASYAHNYCSQSNTGVKAKVTVATPEEDYYDVHYIKLDLNATNQSTAISGSATTKATVVVPSMSEYYFELINQLTIDSAKVDGQLMPVTSVSSVVHKIALPTPLPANTDFTVEIFYHGAPVGGTSFFTIGILNGTAIGTNDKVTHTVSPAYHSRDWFPCKQSLRDKIDSVDVWITVDDTLKVASNGLLKQVTPMNAGKHRFEWASRYPIDFYLISFAVAPYVEYNYYMHFGPNDSMLVQNYIYDHPLILQDYKDELDSIADYINYFSEIFGPYPFKNEKFGTCLAPLGGGMENQTMVTLGNLDPTLITHELAHMWWGDNVTCATWKDVWINEGWATYAEQLFMEYFRGAAAAKAERTAVFNSVMTGVGGSVYVADTTTDVSIYNYRLTYEKGASVAHMLRYIIDNDSLYFQTLRNFNQQYAYSTATTEDLKSVAEQVSGLDLDTFFHQWIYKEGYPRYSARWIQNGNQVKVELSHTSSRPLSVPVFKLPVELRLKSAQGDTIIRVYNDQATQLYSFDWSQQVDSVFIDPNDHLVNRVLTISKDPSLSVGSLREHELRIFPNPSAQGWKLEGLLPGSKLVLNDMNGRKVWEGLATTDSLVIPSALLAPGTYLLTISQMGKTPLNYHLIR